MKSILLYSPAKLNLSLKVLGKRKDGFHNLLTIFERVDLVDDVRLTQRFDGKIRIFCQDKDVPRGPKNLIYKVALVLKKDFGILEGVDIKITKRIPVAAGLGGGSSNAATALLGLNKLWNLKLNHSKLLSYASSIGSDVAFFLYNASFAQGEGRGEIVKPLKMRQKLWHVVVAPKIKVYSREVFTNLKAPPALTTNLLTKARTNVSILRRFLEENDLSQAGKFLSNDLEPVILKLHPSLLSLKKNVAKLNPHGFQFSGSGPAFFALAESKKEAQYFRGVLGKLYGRVFVVRTL